MNFCVKWKKISMQGMGVIEERQCGKPAVIVDIHGRRLCATCYNKWFEKVEKSKKLKIK